MRLTIFALFVVFSGSAYAADLLPAGTAESEARAEQAIAAQAERDAARAAKEAAERKAALEEAERKAAAETAEREEAERKAAAEAAERAAREEAERQAAAEAAERAAREEAERKAAAAREEAERQAAAERAAREEAERKAAAEAAERAAREEAERKAAAEAAAREEAERQAAAERAAREEAERKAAAAREEAERQAAAERAAKEQAERDAAAKKAAGETNGPAAQATVMNLGDMQLASSAAACNLPVKIDDEAAAKAIADRARSDVEANAAAPAQLIIVVQESVASLASAYALDRVTVSRAYFNEVCQKLVEMAGRLPLALGPLLANLADTLGVAYGAAAERTGIASLAAQPGNRAAARQAETAARDDGSQPSTRNAQRRRARPGAADSASPTTTPDAGERDMAAAASPNEPEERGTPAANGKATPPGGGPEVAASGEGAAGDAPQSSPMAAPDAGSGTASGMLGEAECRALGVLGNCPDLNAVLERLLEKPLEYNHAKEMILGRNTQISLVLRTDWEGDDLPKEISEELKGLPGEVKQGISKITRIMSAELSGRSFDIQPSGRQERSAVPPQPVRWRWQVKPTATGKDQTLRLRLYAHLPSPQGTIPPILVKTLDATINVDVTPWDWVVSQARMLKPIYAIGAALIGLLTAILAFLLARRRREAYVDGATPEPRAAYTGPDSDGTITDAGPVIGDVNQSAADSRPPAAPPGAAGSGPAASGAPPPLVDEEEIKPEAPPAEDGSETNPDGDGGPKTS